MSWRSVCIRNPCALTLKENALIIKQEETVRVPLEDIAVILLETQQITLTAALLSACSDRGIIVLTINQRHLPNGINLPFLPHSRSLQIMRLQLALTEPQKKRLWQEIVRIKIKHQAIVLLSHNFHFEGNKLKAYSDKVRSGDPDNYEAIAAQLYFVTLFGKAFSRQQDILINACLDYGYSIIRSAIARNLVIHGFLPAFGLHHHSEQNSFNLADDIIEPYRPFVDIKVLQILDQYPKEENLIPPIKNELIGLLHQDFPFITTDGEQHRTSMLTQIENSVESLQKNIKGQKTPLIFPQLLLEQ